MPNVVVLDIETIPDYTVWADGEPPNGEAPAPSTEPKKRGRGRPPKAKFAPVYAHQVVCIGVVIVQDGKCVGIGDACATTKEHEKNLLEWIGGYLSKDLPIDTLVTWNGRGFDVPVIQLRSLHHGVPQAWIDSEMRKRYTERHTDLCDLVSEFGKLGMTGFNLDTFSQLIGMPGKGDTDGSMVEGMVRDGKLSLVAAYCKRDVVQTAAVWMRWQLMRGFWTLEQYREAASSLLQQARHHDGMRHEEFRVNQALFEVL